MNLFRKWPTSLLKRGVAFNWNNCIQLIFILQFVDNYKENKKEDKIPCKAAAKIMGLFGKTPQKDPKEQVQDFADILPFKY